MPSCIVGCIVVPDLTRPTMQPCIVALLHCCHPGGSGNNAHCSQTLQKCNNATMQPCIVALLHCCHPGGSGNNAHCCQTLHEYNNATTQQRKNATIYGCIAVVLEGLTTMRSVVRPSKSTTMPQCNNSTLQ